MRVRYKVSWPETGPDDPARRIVWKHRYCTTLAAALALASRKNHHNITKSAYIDRQIHPENKI